MRLSIFKRLLLLILSFLFLFSLSFPSNVSAIEKYSGFIYPWDNLKGNATMGLRGTPIHDGKAFDVIRTSYVNKSEYPHVEILAPKDGYVIFSKDDTPDGEKGDCANMAYAANYIVIGHGPKALLGEYDFYTVYMHLQYNSIPPEFEASPTNHPRVNAGDKIATTGDTGYTAGVTGVHLHFFGTREPMHEEERVPKDCKTDASYPKTDWLVYNFDSTQPVGFEEKANSWDSIASMSASQAFETSRNKEGLYNTNCDPATAKAILYEHVDFGGECFEVDNTVPTTNTPGYIAAYPFNVSSVYLNPLYFGPSVSPTHTLHLYDQQYGIGRELSTKHSLARLPDGWNDSIKSLHNSEDLPPWLEEKSFAEDLPFETDIHIRVDDPGDFDAMRVCFDGENCQETSSTELFYTWNTYGLADGTHIIRIQYRVDSDSGNWANAEKLEEGYYLSPERQGYAPCGESVDSVQLTSGSDCIKVTTDMADMAPVGWADRSDLQACVDGDDMVVWLYDGVRDQFGNFPGTPHVITDGNCRSVGGNVSSVDIRSVEELAPIPETAYTLDPDTVHLYHFDEGSGSTLGDVRGTLNGSINSSNWVSGKFGNALQFPNPTDGRAVTMGTMDVCPMTVEMWVKTSSSTGGRLAGQLGGGGNSGSNKWLLSLDGKKPKFEIWSAGGSLNTVSYREVEDDGWHHIMATYDCSTKKAILYQDGEKVGEMTSAATWNSGATTFEIGAGEGIYKCNCSIDELRVSNVIRTVQHPREWGLMPNGGFETLSSGWASNWTKNASSISIDTQASGEEGANSLKFTTNASNTQAFSSNIDVEYQHQYEFTQYVKSNSGSGEFGYYIDEYDDEDNWVSGQWKEAIYGSHDGYVQFDYTPTSANVAKAALQYYMSANTTFTVYVDAVSIYEEDRPNLVSNASFENLSSGWADSWTRNNTTAVTINTGSNGNDGANSLYFSTDSNHHHAFSDYIPVVADGNYSWSSYVKSTSGSGESGFYIDEYDENHNWISGHWFDAIYGEVDGTYNFVYTPTDENVAFVGLQYYMNGGTTFGAYIDSVSFTRE